MKNLALFLQMKAEKRPFPFFSQLLSSPIKLNILQKSSTDVVSFDFTATLRGTFYGPDETDRNINYAQGHSARILLGFEPMFSDSNLKHFYISC